MFVPAKTKYPKVFKARTSIVKNSGSKLGFCGEYGLKSLDFARIDSSQIESARRVISRVLNRTGKVWIHIFPNIPVTKKPIEVRMGKGKGSVDRWVFPVAPGRMLFEVAGVSSSSLVIEALQKAAKKLPVRCKVVCSQEEY